MKLIYNIALRLTALLPPLIAVWAVIFYSAMVREINDEADDALEDYSELIIIRMLAGEPLPKMNEGSNNSYSVTAVSEEYAAAHPAFRYYDAEVWVPEKEETEPARVLVTVFRDGNGGFRELRVAMPTFEKEDLLRTVLTWVVLLYLLLMLTCVGITLWVFRKSMRPLYALLDWLDGYIPGRKSAPVPDGGDIMEFRKLNEAAQQAVDRFEKLFEQQKQFIGNASHELQTPLAVLQGRMEYLLDNARLDDMTAGEIAKMQGTLSRIIRLNKTLLLLTRIENGQFLERTELDLAALIREHQEIYAEIHAGRQIRCRMELPESAAVVMNEALASLIVGNLLKNAYVHSPDGAEIHISLDGGTLEISNSGEEALDAEHIFDRFFQGSKKEGSTGLGLALVRASAEFCRLGLVYRHSGGMHIFRVDFGPVMQA